jgi:site-specific DNA-methyltransferase (adenine-specific)
MSLLLHGDCLEHMKGIDSESVDFIFCDLPYGQTSCKWDCCIDLEKFWIEVMRIKKLRTPIFMTTTTKFGVELINSAPKKCPFRYDLVWVKSAPAGFLSAKKMPMRKHEMVYVFYEKLPFYDLSTHQHKFIKEVPTKRAGKDGVDNAGMIKNRSKSGMETINKYDPPLPVSVVKEPKTINTLYGDDVDVPDYVNKRNKETGMSAYDPPLPTTMLEIKSSRGKHSTEKPVALMEWLLKYFSKEGDVVLDPTMGSGSTGVACKNMNRNFIGIELDPEIYEVAVNRID